MEVLKSMFNKRTVVPEIIFLFLVGLSSVHYFDIGRWKSYVRLFGAVEIVMLLAALAFFTVRVLKKCPINNTPLLFTYGILCVMQLFPMIGAIVIIHSYRYSAVHLIIMMFGILSIVLLTRHQKVS